MAGNILIKVPFSNFFNLIKPFSIGFDLMFAEFDRMLDSSEFTGKYPTYKIIKKNGMNYSIEINIGDFTKKDIKIETSKNFLSVIGNQKFTKNKSKEIEKKQFTKSFVFTDNFKVKKAKMNNRVLKIYLVGNTLKPKKEKPNLIKVQ
jgi:molecular chaperone IbpA|tara:strand:- start:134 stop:574 length:441 start_codon:yes stop_codon:yes gene_type:complete